MSTQREVPTRLIDARGATIIVPKGQTYTPDNYADKFTISLPMPVRPDQFKSVLELSYEVLKLEQVTPTLMSVEIRSMRGLVWSEMNELMAKCYPKSEVLHIARTVLVRYICRG